MYDIENGKLICQNKMICLKSTNRKSVAHKMAISWIKYRISWAGQLSCYVRQYKLLK